METSFETPRDGRWMAWFVAVAIGLGAITVMLAVLPSALFDLDRFIVPKEATLLATALLATTAVLLRTPRLDLGISEWLLGCYLLVSAASAVLATNRWLAFASLGVSLGGAGVFLGARYAAARGARAALVGALVVAIVAGGATGLAQAYGWESALLANTRAPGGTLGNRNFLAHLMVLGLPLAGWLMLSSRSRLVAVMMGLAAAAMVAAVVLSRSRAAWVGFGAMLLVTTVVGLASRGPVPRLARGRLTGFFAALAIGSLAALVIPNQLEWRSRSPYRDSLRDVINYKEGSGRGRLIQYRNSLALVERHPLLGVGPGNWFVSYPLVTGPGDPSYAAADPIPTNPWPSSDWIALVTERGPVAALLWISWLAALGIIALRRVRDPSLGSGGLAAIGLLTAVMVEGLFDAVALLAPPTLVAMAGLAAVLPPTRPVRSLEVAPRRGRLLLLTWLFLGGLLAKSLAQVQSILVADNGYRRDLLASAARWDPGSHRLQLILAQRTSCPAAAHHADRAADLLPHHPWPRRLRQRCR